MVCVTHYDCPMPFPDPGPTGAPSGRDRLDRTTGSPHLSGWSARIAAAPVTWGVCEVPGWGHQLDPATVLGQMRDRGISATEFGPDGFLPAAAGEKAATLARYGLRGLGQFVPVVLHDPATDPLPVVREAMDGLVAAGAGVVVVAAATGQDGYDERPILDEPGWTTLTANLERVSAEAAARGLVAALHPHVGTMIETGAETVRVLRDSTVDLCLDTGHLLVGGGDPVEVAGSHPGRIAHVHLKDVRLDVAEQVRAGRLGYAEAVARNMYVPLGRGDVDIEAIVHSLESHGYMGWYVIEQDTMLDPPPGPPDDLQPSRDARASMDYLMSIDTGPIQPPTSVQTTTERRASTR